MVLTANKQMKLSESLTDRSDGWVEWWGVAITHTLRWIIPSFVSGTMRARRAGFKKDRHTVSSQEPLEGRQPSLRYINKKETSLRVVGVWDLKRKHC